MKIKAALPRLRLRLFHPRSRQQPYPHHVCLELTSRCNMKCPHCYRQNGYAITDATMDYERATQLLAEVARHPQTVLRLGWRGEVLLYPRILDILDQVRQAQPANVIVYTNGTRLKDDAICQALVRLKRLEVRVSVDGTQQQYESVRFPMKYQELRAHLGRLREHKLRHKSKTCITAISNWRHVMPCFGEFAEDMRPLVDKIIVKPTVLYDNESPVEKPPRTICRKMYEQLYVGADGACGMCCADARLRSPVGCALTHSVGDIFDGEILRGFRRVMEEGDLMSIEACKYCHRSAINQKAIGGRLSITVRER